MRNVTTHISITFIAQKGNCLRLNLLNATLFNSSHDGIDAVKKQKRCHTFFADHQKIFVKILPAEPNYALDFTTLCLECSLHCIGRNHELLLWQCIEWVIHLGNAQHSFMARLRHFKLLSEWKPWDWNWPKGLLLWMEVPQNEELFKRNIGARAHTHTHQSPSNRHWKSTQPYLPTLFWPKTHTN